MAKKTKEVEIKKEDVSSVGVTSEKVAIPEAVQINNNTEVVRETEKILVDKYLLFKMFKTCVQGNSYTGHSAVAKFGEILGAKNRLDQIAEWKKAQEYLAKETK